MKRKTALAVGALVASVGLVSRIVILTVNLGEIVSSISRLPVVSSVGPSSGLNATAAERQGAPLRRGPGTPGDSGILGQLADRAISSSALVGDALGMMTGEDPAGGGPLSGTASSEGQGPPTVERTLSFGTGQFGLGYRNSAMAFAWFVMYAVENNYTSIVLESLNWEDYYGRGRYPWGFVPHSLLFDVEHWNAFYPQLPRLISVNATRNLTTPVDSHGNYHNAFIGYQAYSKRVASDPVRYPKSPTEIVMLRGAFRPSRLVQGHMDKLTGGATYAALHARIEPDMQKHMYCLDRKVLRLSEIVRLVEAHFPSPSFDRLFVATNRPMLEAEVERHDPRNKVAAENLRELNRIRDVGMWNGTVAVFEAGSSYLRGSDDILGSYVGISGAVLDYFLALQSSVFIGTEVSSFSADLIQSRFYRSEHRNYNYRPDGLHIPTNERDIVPPNFVC